MNRQEAKYHAVTLVATLIDDFLKDAEMNHRNLDKSAIKIVKEVVKIKRRIQSRADRLSRGFAKFTLDDTLRK